MKKDKKQGKKTLKKEEKTLSESIKQLQKKNKPSVTRILVINPSIPSSNKQQKAIRNVEKGKK